MKKFLFDLFPLFLFFIAYRYTDIFIATGVAMAAAVAQIVWLKATGRATEAMHWINLTVILVFGGATIWLHSDVFIKWKPTVLYWLFGGALVFARLLFGRNLIRRLMEKQIQLPDSAWERLNLVWAAFFLVAGALNLYVAFSGHFTESQWVSFKRLRPDGADAGLRDRAIHLAGQAHPGRGTDAFRPRHAGRQALIGPCPFPSGARAPDLPLFRHVRYPRPHLLI